MLRFRWIPHAAAVCALAACACVDRETPAATPAALLHRDAVPLGGPVEITLRFHMSMRALPLEKNSRVLMRLMYDDGKVMANYDHEPPRPSDQWLPGMTVTYTRRIFVPEVPYVGDVPLVVGLASASGDRLRLSGKDVGDRMYEVATVKVHAQRTLIFYDEGWHPHEGALDEIGFRWTHGQATMTFRNPRRDGVLHLRLSTQSDVFPTPQQASILVGSVIAKSFPVASAETDYEVPLTAADVGAEDDVVLTIKVDKTFVPARVQKGRDRRELGIRVHNVFLETRPP